MSSKKWRTLCGSAPSKSVVLVVTRKPRCSGELDRFDGVVVGAFAANGEIVFFALAIHMDGKGQIFAGREEVRAFL